ncbi:MAG: hypothetical protein IPK58_24400 [Acidobacteria bacterium]|nr:hypothetical protein [Acidobacteriota bacterium]
MDYETLLFKSRFNDAAELETLTQLGQLRTVRAIGSRVGTYLSFARFYQGLPVFDEVVSVLVDSDRQISRVRSNLATISVPKPIEIPDDADREIVLQTAIDAVGAKGVAIGGKTAKG